MLTNEASIPIQAYGQKYLNLKFPRTDSLSF